MGFNPIILTGDNRQTALAIGRGVGIENVIAEVLPDQKSDKVAELQKAGQRDNDRRRD